MSTTPRTDAVLLPINSHTLPADLVYADFARQLERELSNFARRYSMLADENRLLAARLSESKKRDLLYASQISLTPGYAPIDVYINTSGSSSREILTRIEPGDTLYVMRKASLPTEAERDQEQRKLSVAAGQMAFDAQSASKLVCPTCNSAKYAEIYPSKTDPTGYTLYCRRCEEGCVSPKEVKP